MGNQYTKEQEGKFNHPRLGPSLKLNSRMLIQVKQSCQHIIIQWQNLIKQYKKKLNTKYILFPTQYQVHNNFLCNQTIQLKVLFEYFPTTLQLQINQRELSQNYFIQIQLWDIFQALLRAAVCFQELGLRGADIRPCNIFFNPKKQIKLYSIFSFPRQKSGYFNMLHHQQPAFLSPQQFKQLNYQICTKVLKQFGNPAKSDTFSISASLLSAILLTEFGQVIKADEGKMDIRNFQQMVSQLDQTFYSKQLVLYVKEGLQIDQKLRPLPSELLQKVVENKQLINSRTIKRSSIQGPTSINIRKTPRR